MDPNGPANSDAVQIKLLSGGNMTRMVILELVNSVKDLLIEIFFLEGEEGSDVEDSSEFDNNNT